MREKIFYHRCIEPRLAEALEDSPVVLIQGPRQCGKTTLTQYAYSPNYSKWGTTDLMWDHQRFDLGRSVQHRDYTYISFDDDVARAGARADPVGFVSELPDRVILDEVQYVPEIFPSIKLRVDRHRTNGCFILTGSTDVLFVPTLSESLAGRMQTICLFPLAQYELVNKSLDSESDSATNFLKALFGQGFGIRHTKRLGKELAERIVSGGFAPALILPTARRQANWYRNYVNALVQRDLRDLTRISSPDVLSRLLSVACSQTAHLFNLSDLAAPFQLSRTTITEYVRLLERFFLLDKLPPWYSNRLKRLVKTSKLHVTDTGLASALLGVGVDKLINDRHLYGQILETFVYQELRKQASWNVMPTKFFHFRDRDGAEVDIVMEGDSGRVAGVEVKASATVTDNDFRGLKKLAKAAGDRFCRGVVLYDGEFSVSFGRRFHCVPIRQLWEIA